MFNLNFSLTRITLYIQSLASADWWFSKWFNCRTFLPWYLCFGSLIGLCSDWVWNVQRGPVGNGSSKRGWPPRAKNRCRLVLCSWARRQEIKVTQQLLLADLCTITAWLYHSAFKPLLFMNKINYEEGLAGSGRQLTGLNQITVQSTRLIISSLVTEEDSRLIGEYPSHWANEWAIPSAASGCMWILDAILFKMVQIPCLAKTM